MDKCLYPKQEAGGEWQCSLPYGHKGRHEPPLVKAVSPTGTVTGQSLPTNLQAQLAEARAENEALSAKLEIQTGHTGTAGKRISWWRNRWDAMLAERDAAIERGVAVWKGAEQQRGMLLLLLWMRTVEHDDDHEALDRAEDREKALREALEKRGYHAPKDCGDRERARLNLIDTNKSCIYCEPALAALEGE